MIEIELSSSNPESSRAILRPLTGLDEIGLSDPGLQGVLWLLNRLLVERSDSLRRSQVYQLTVSDVDRILAGLYREMYGEQADCRSTCSFCDKSFEFSLSIKNLFEPQKACKETVKGPDEKGIYTLSDGAQFRLLTLNDILNLPERSPSAILNRSIVKNPENRNPEVFEAAMEQVGPVASQSIETHCAYCQEPQSLDFDLADYFISMLGRERSFLLRETHVLARAYHWTLREILALPRKDRLAFVQLVEADVNRRRRTVA